MSSQPHTINGVEAVRLAAAGFRVFALHTVGDGSCTCFRGKACSRPGKHPIQRGDKGKKNGGFYKASRSLPTVIRDFDRWPYANVGLRTGEGLGVLDVDVAKGGYESLSELVAKYGELVPSWSVTTGSGGINIHFRIHEELRNSVGKVAPGIDFRGDGGFVVAPGSRHISGGRYAWIRGRTPSDMLLGDMPEWLVEICKRRPTFDPAALDQDGNRILSDPENSVLGDPASWLFRAVDRTLCDIAGAPEGTRNQTLYMKSIWAGRLVAGDALPYDDICEELFDAACQCGLEEYEARTTIANGMKFGTSKPRRLFFEEAGGRGRQFRYADEIDAGAIDSARLGDTADMPDAPRPSPGPG